MRMCVKSEFKTLKCLIKDFISTFWIFSVADSHDPKIKNIDSFVYTPEPIIIQNRTY